MRDVLLGLDLALRREAHAEQSRAHALAGAGLGQEQEVFDVPSQHDDRRDHARLRRQQQRLARIADRELLDVVREHRLEECLRTRAAHGHEVARAGGCASRRHGHGH